MSKHFIKSKCDEIGVHLVALLLMSQRDAGNQETLETFLQCYHNDKFLHIF
jgi:hypothetical protein